MYGLLALATTLPATALQYPRIQGDPRKAVAVDAPAKKVGAWEAPRRWPVIGVHAFVLPTGEVLHYAYSSAHGEPEERHYYSGSHAVVWNPKGDSFFDISWDGTVFCSGHSFLPDGRLFITGGLEQEECLTQGRKETWLLDPFTLEWTEGPEMSVPRYYPSNVTMGDGSVMVLSGNTSNCTLTPKMEMFYPDKGVDGKIKGVSPGKRQLMLYPRVHLLPDGRVVHTGPEESTWVWSPKTKEWTRLENTRLSVRRLEGASFQVPGDPWKVMTCGGYADYDVMPTETCEVIDFSQPTPTWMPAASMHFKRAHANAVLLPDGRVLMVGGGASGLYESPEFNAELYDPETDSWELLPAQRWGRMYHSTAILLPDGRVLSSGQDEHPASANDSGAWAEFYKPSYLFGAGPKIRQAPEAVGLGESMVLNVKGAKKIRKVALMGLSAMTHSVNSGQRHVWLDHQRIGKSKELEVFLPDNENLVPPGYYMLFVLNKKGRASEARMIRVSAEPVQSESEPARKARHGDEKAVGDPAGSADGPVSETTPRAPSPLGAEPRSHPVGQLIREGHGLHLRF